MKRFLKVGALILLLSIVYLVISGNSISYNKSTDVTIISPHSEELSRLSKLYFIDEDELVTESRIVTIHNLDTPYSVLLALKQGSKIESYDHPIADDAMIISVKVSDRICYVDLTEEFLVDDEDRLYLNVISIVNTLTEIESIDRVQVLIDGKDNVFSSFGLNKSFQKDNNVVRTEELTYKDVLKKYLNYISLGRYDLAYDMIDSTSKQNVSFNDFRESMIPVREELKGYIRRYFFTKRIDDYYELQVRYVLRELNNQNRTLVNAEDNFSRDYDFNIIKEDGIWKIQHSF